MTTKSFVVKAFIGLNISAAILFVIFASNGSFFESHPNYDLKFNDTDAAFRILTELDTFEEIPQHFYNNLFTPASQFNKPYFGLK